MSTPVHYHLGKFPPATLAWEQLIPLLGPASAGLARYDGLLSAIPNAAVLLSPLTTQEAVLSSRIEGTEATIAEVMEVEAGGKPEGMTESKRDDVGEIINYRAALQICTREVSTRPLSQHLLRQAHAALMKGVRGRNQSPGSYREKQNWIGPEGCPIEKARFVPIPQEHLQSGMDAWERYLVNIDVPDPLVQLALVHAEFEAIHPFKDGNGRLGRMIIPLFLFTKKLLSGPDFYMSAYLDTHRKEYVERLRAISADGDWTGWCAFFLRALADQAAENERKARAILDLYSRMKKQMVALTHSRHSIRATDFLFETPIFKAPDFIKRSAIPKPSATRILTLLRNERILHSMRQGRGRRAGIFAFRELLNIVEGRKVF